MTSVGQYGTLCGAKSISYIVPTNGKLVKLRRAKCNRWSQHSDHHIERCPKTFRILAEWTEAETAARED